MGKGFYNDKARIIAATILSLVLFAALKHAEASYREFELFDRGYEYYLSYQIEKAVETFKIFLKEFPDSSAKDAAMFWLGKSLMQLESFEDAEKIFSEMKQRFPESPFISYINVEFETMNKSKSKVSKAEPGGDLQRTLEERDRLKLLLEDEKRKADEMKLQVTRLEVKEAERQQLESQVQALTVDKALIESESEELRDKVKKYEATVIKIKDKRYIAPEILKYMIASSSVLTKMGIKEVLWRTGNFYEDFVNEQILYDEAKRLNITVDMKKHKELIERYNLKSEEDDYLYRYLTIGNLIGRKLKDLPGEKVVESLRIRYAESDKLEKAIFAAELQKDARTGRSFEDIYKSYPDAIRLKVTGFQELQEWIKHRIQLLKDGEISEVIWTEDEYIILRPLVKKLSYKPFEDIQPEIKDEMRNFVKRWIDELGKEER